MTSSLPPLGRRRFALGAGAFLLGRHAAAQTFPSQTVRIVVPYAPGGGNDQIARVLAGPMAATLGREVIVENRPGAGSMIGTRAVATAPADGHTLLLSSTSMSTNALIYRNPGYRMADFAAIAPLLASPMTLSVSSQVPVKNLAELVAYAKANPGKLNYASLGPATITTLTMERLRLAAGINVAQVPYPGAAPAMNAVLAGQVELMMDGMANSLAQAQSARIRLLAVTRHERSPMAHDLPTFKEQGYPSLSVGSWAGMFVPANTPAPVLIKLRTTVVKVLADPKIQESLSKLGFDPWPGTADDFPRYLAEESAAWERDVKAAGIAQID